MTRREPPTSLLPSTKMQTRTTTTTRPPPPLQRPGDDFSLFKRWFPWLVPTFVVANVVLFGVTMYLNDCPRNSFSCFARFLGRFSFQPLKENPLLGPSSVTTPARYFVGIAQKLRDGVLLLLFLGFPCNFFNITRACCLTEYLAWNFDKDVKHKGSFLCFLVD
ncbi:hypothetical protein Dimus_009145 [Dionaea muscipula]